MDFQTLHDRLPYVVGAKKHILEHSPYPGITLLFPGSHQGDTDPRGGDFVVAVTSKTLGWDRHKFTHNDIFADLEGKVAQHAIDATELINQYIAVVQGTDPEVLTYSWPPDWHGVNPVTFLRAVQCLAVAEHRRYARFEPKGGGRYLPVRFAAGIVAGKWTANDCANMQKRGRPGVEILEKAHNFDSLDFIKGEK